MHIKEVEKGKIYEETLSAIGRCLIYHNCFSSAFVLFSSKLHVNAC